MDTDLLPVIFKYLPFNDLIKIVLVSSQYNKAAHSKLLWKQLCIQHFPERNITDNFEHQYIFRTWMMRKYNNDCIPEEAFNSYNKKIGILPKEIYLCANLNWFDIRLNNLTVLPKEICQLTDLEQLYLCNNKLKTLPTGFEKLTKLQCLYLSNNLFEKIPNEIYKLPKLKVLLLNGNPLDLSNKLHLFKHFREVIIDKKQLIPSNMKHIIQFP